MNAQERVFVIRDDVIRQRFASFLAKLDLAKPWEVVLRPFIGKRTSEQNARLWKLHALAGQVTGYSAEEMHEFALMRFFGSKEIKVGGMIRQVPLKRSSKRNKKEFGELMESTEAWYIMNFGVWLDREAA